MSFSKELCKALKNNKLAIIYGYADIGTCVLKYIINLETDIKLANYSGKVKFFATTSEQRTSKRIEKMGIKIKPIVDLVEYKDDAIVIVATQEKHHKDISDKLDECGFKNRLYVLREDYCELREKVENHNNIHNNRIGQYHINHRIKLEHLRHKVEFGKKVKVFFMVHDSAVFGAASVYSSMEKNDLFEPYIFVVSRRDVSYVDFMIDVAKDVAFFKEHGYRVICGYDEDGVPKDIHGFRPDILFFDLPKMHGAASSFYNRLDHLNWEYLTCYIPYGLNMIDSFYYHYHLDAIRESWKYFPDSKYNYLRCLSDADFNGFNPVYVGYPKFDDYIVDSDNIPKKIDNGKPIVIYAPHHSFGVTNNLATFDLYAKDILEFAKKHQSMNFVFKPHPLLKYQIPIRFRQGRINISEDDYQKFLSEWNGLQNGIVVETGEYINLFKKSKCMITDCGSFIGEYLPSKQPCIYLLNPRKEHQLEMYTAVASRILDTYYVVKDKSGLMEALNMVVVNGIDPKYNERVKCLDREFGSIGSSGERLCRYLEEELRS